MPMLAAKASRVDRKWTSFPSTRMVPESAAWTPAMIFIIVLLPAPFSPARPWISPAFSVKSTFRSAWTPPNDFEMSVSSSSAIGASTRSDQELLLHPQHAVGVRLGDHWPVGDDVLRNVRPRLRAVDDGLHAGNDRSAVNTARWIADRRIHLAILHRLDRGGHGVDAADLGLGAALGLHHLEGGEGHVVILEERRVDLRIFGEERLPDAGDLGHVPVGRLLVEHLDLREFRDDLVEALRPPLSAGVAERPLSHDDRAFAVDRVDERLSDRSAHIYVVGREKGEDVDGVERRDQRVHVDDRNAGLDHLVDRSGQGADAERLDGDEIPLLRGHVVDRGALLDRVEL